MMKLYFGNSTAIIASFLIAVNLGFVLWVFAGSTSIQKWGSVIVVLLLLNGVLWYYANIRDLYSNSIVHAVDGSVKVGLFAVGSVQSLVYWIASGSMWIAGIIAIFMPQYRQSFFYMIGIVAIIQLVFIEGSRILLYNSMPSSFDYM